MAFHIIGSVTTGSVTLSATATKYVRTTGSFVTDNFVVGQVITAAGFGVGGNNGTKTITAVVALEITVAEALTIEAAAAGRSLTYPGVTVPVASASTPSSSYEEIGERARAFNGTLRSTVRARKQTWTVVTKPLAQADATTLLGLLTGTPPVAATGDLTGAVSVHPVISGVSRVKIGGGYRVVVEYSLMEA